MGGTVSDMTAAPYSFSESRSVNVIKADVVGWEVGKTIIGVGSIAADKLFGAERVGDITAWTAVCV